VRRKALKVTVFSVLWVLGLLVIGAAAFYWRLSQGPISLAFMGQSIEKAINRQLPGFKIQIGEADLELDSETKTPHIRVRNLVLSDLEGDQIASAPKAGVALDVTNLMSGSVSIQSLDLIGAKINVRRNLDGSMQLGFDNQTEAAETDVSAESEIVMGEVPGKSSKADATSQNNKPLVSGSRILELLDAGGETGSLSKLQEVRISRAVLKVYDEANDATWQVPRADFAFRRVSSGFVIAGKASVASGGDPWHLETSLTFRQAEHNYTANVAIEGVVPATVAGQIFALSQFARLTTPLSGNFEIDAKETGEVTRIDGQLFAAAGQVNLPEYLANPIIIDEGTLRIRNAGPGKPFEVLESSLLIGGSRADLKGTVMPRRTEDGHVTAYDIELSADNVKVDAQGTLKDPVFVDRVSFKGSAAVEEQRVDIDDLVVMAGSAGVRLRGIITGGDNSPGIKAAGRLRAMSAGLLKKLWPPILAPKTRAWIDENVQQGVVDDGVFEINLAPNALALAQTQKRMPDDAVSLSFSMRDVRTHYFKTLPVLQGASGKASLKSGVFNMNIDKGFVDLASGSRLNLAEGSFEAHDLLSGAVPGSFRFDIQGKIGELIEFAGHPDLNLVSSDFTKFPKIDGNARAVIGLKFPLVKNVPKESVVVTQEVSLSDATLKSVLPGIDLTAGNFAVDVTKELVSVLGPAKLNGVVAKINWQKPRGPGEAKIAVETTLTENMRERMGIQLGSYLSGDVPVKLDIGTGGENVRTIAVEADLSDVAMRVAAAGWSRPATSGTRATFNFVDAGKAGRRIEDLKLDGKGLKLRGNISMSANNALKVVDFDEIRLSENDVFTARIEPGESATTLTISGNTFDARPYIKNLISPAKAGAASANAQRGGNFIVNANFRTVTAHRGESVRNVRGTFVTRAGTITTASIEGEFLSGFPVKIRLTPANGGREMNISSADGGSALRAANFYSKVAGGELTFYAFMANTQGSPIRNGELLLKRFAVRNEATLAELDSRGKPKKSGPRIDGVSFKKLRMPFRTDDKFVRLCGVELKGNDLGGVAKGVIRKSDGALDITGTMVPLQGINGVLDDIPLLGQIFTGGKGEGLFAVTFAMGGTTANPKTQVNPLSAFLPGVFRKILEFQGSCN
jgi:Protein of unknown function/AsmA-like C-terminal region